MSQADEATDEDIEYAWKTLSKMATDVIEKVQLLGDERTTTKVFDQEDLEKERQDTVQRLEAKKPQNFAV